VGGLTAALQVFAFPPLHSPEAAFACLAPGIFWAYLRPRLRLYAWTMFIALAVGWTINLRWLHPVTWAGLIVLGPIVAAWTGAWFGAVWWAMPRIAGRPTPVRLFSVLGLAGLWVLDEWTRTWLFGGFPWMPLSATQWEMRSVIQIAAYTGAYGISFVIVAFNLGFAALAFRLFVEGEKGLRRRSPEFLMGLFLLLVCLSIDVQATTNAGAFYQPFARVAFIQPDVPATLKWDPAQAGPILRNLWQTTRRAGSLAPDLVLWPESTTPYALQGGDPAMKAFVEKLSAAVKAPMLVGADAIEQGPGGTERYYNAAFMVDPVTGVQTRYYAKRRLVQFGEYVPLRPVFGWIGKFAPLGDTDFSPGTDPSPLIASMRSGAEALGVLICYEDLFPALASEEVRSGADALVVLTNDAWYGEGAAAFQHAAHSVLRAVETRRPVLRCGNAGWSGWIDEYGNQRRVMRNAAGSIYYQGDMIADVRRDSRWAGRMSFYVAHGDWFVDVCAVLVAGAYVLLATLGAPLPRPEGARP
jgi:apolipoprotein N-acyltransferase